MASARVIAILEDDPDRTCELTKCLHAQCPGYEVVVFDNAPDMIAWLALHLEELRLVCLDHDLGPNRIRDAEVFDPGTGRDVADYLADRRACRRRPGIGPFWRSEVSQLSGGMVAESA